MANRVVTLFGIILEDSQRPGMTTLDVDPLLGDAPEFGLAGQIAFKDIQVLESSFGPTRDMLRIPEQIAQLKSELAGKVRKRRKR